MRDGEEIIYTRLPRSPGCGAAARRLLEGHLEPLIGSQALADVKLVVSELVNNAYLHGEGTIELRVYRRSGRVRVEVVDQGEEAPVRMSRSQDLWGGRGLRIVDQVAVAWGSHPGKTHVWAELAIG
jgi:anti-sigma regulatory factor (Ser/Thr protein kinase)